MTETTSLYQEVLDARGNEPLASPRPPRPSAAVILWRRRPDGELEVFWVRRSERVRFMPGWHAFVGGSVSRTDVGLPIVGQPSGLRAQRAPEALPPGQRGEASSDDGVPACALRELFEEVGLLVVDGEPPTPEILSRAREALLDDPGSLDGFLRENDLALDVSRLIFAGRWLTPPFAPLRFDNRFYLLEWPADRARQPDVWPGELAAGEWIPPREAHERWERTRILAAPPILHILSVLGDAGPEEGLARLQLPREAELGPHRRIEFRPGIVMFPLPSATLPPATHTNCYLLGREEAVLVDPGSNDPEAQRQLVEALRQAEARLGRRTVAIWLTHHHPDHVAGAADLAEALGLPVRAHPATAESLARVGLEVEGILEEGTELELGPGFSVRIHHTPGHARGHVAIWVENQRALLCGDLVSALSTIVIDPPEGHMGDYLASLARMADLAPATLFPGHGPILAHGRRVLERAREHRLWREQRVLEAWQQGRRDPAAILPLVYDELPDGIRPLAERQIRAHLEHLQETEQLRSLP